MISDGKVQIITLTLKREALSCVWHWFEVISKDTIRPKWTQQLTQCNYFHTTSWTQTRWAKKNVQFPCKVLTSYVFLDPCAVWKPTSKSIQAASRLVRHCANHCKMHKIYKKNTTITVQLSQCDIQNTKNQRLTKKVYRWKKRVYTNWIRASHPVQERFHSQQLTPTDILLCWEFLLGRHLESRVKFDLLFGNETEQKWGHEIQCTLSQILNFVWKSFKNSKICVVRGRREGFPALSNITLWMICYPTRDLLKFNRPG